MICATILSGPAKGNGVLPACALRHGERSSMCGRLEWRAIARIAGREELMATKSTKDPK